MVMARSILDFESDEMGSEVIIAPGFMVTSVLPLNFNSLLVVASMVFPPVDTAIFTAFSVTALVLNAFEKRMRRLSLPIETRTICRKELLVNPGAGGTFPGSTSCGAVLQVPTHFLAEWEFIFSVEHELSSTANMLITEKKRRKEWHLV